MTAASGVALPSVWVRVSQSAAAYVVLTKPRIIELLLVTTLPSMMLAAHGLPAARLVIATLGFGTLAAGSANVLNCWFDRDIDAVMERTRHRPLNGDLVTPGGTLAVGLMLGLLAVAGFAVFTDAGAAVGAGAAIAFYVLVYTVVLKRRTSANIVWGGAAGCMPVIIGWTAVTGSVGWGAVVLFAVVFFWTPPHFWSLAMKYRDDYARAGVPMLPVVADAITVARHIIVYSYAMVAVSLLLWPAASTGVVYPIAAAAAGTAFLVQAHALSRRIRRGEPARSMVLFQWSISYLTVLFLAVAADALLR